MVRLSIEANLNRRSASVEDPEFEEALARLSDPFSLNLSTALWLGGAAAVLVTLVVLCMTGVLS